MWIIIGKIFVSALGSLFDVAVKLFEMLKKKPEEIVREKDAAKQAAVLHDLAHPDSPDSKPYTVRMPDDNWGKGNQS